MVILLEASSDEGPRRQSINHAFYASLKKHWSLKPLSSTNSRSCGQRRHELVIFNKNRTIELCFVKNRRRGCNSDTGLQTSDNKLFYHRKALYLTLDLEGVAIFYFNIDLLSVFITLFLFALFGHFSPSV